MKTRTLWCPSVECARRNHHWPSTPSIDPNFFLFFYPFLKYNENGEARTNHHIHSRRRQRTKMQSSDIIFKNDQHPDHEILVGNKNEYPIYSSFLFSSSSSPMMDEKATHGRWNSIISPFLVDSRPVVIAGNRRRGTRRGKWRKRLSYTFMDRVRFTTSSPGPRTGRFFFTIGTAWPPLLPPVEMAIGCCCGDNSCCCCRDRTWRRHWPLDDDA